MWREKEKKENEKEKKKKNASLLLGCSHLGSMQEDTVKEKRKEKPIRNIVERNADHARRAGYLPPIGRFDHRRIQCAANPFAGINIHIESRTRSRPPKPQRRLCNTRLHCCFDRSRFAQKLHASVLPRTPLGEVSPAASYPG